MRRLLALLLATFATNAAAFDLQGHRGARGLAPENTLASFEEALKHGVTTLETDLGITRDGVIVISHDPTLNPDITRGPDGKFLEARGPAIFSMAFAELQRYDIGRMKPDTPYAKNFPDQKPADGQRFPRLDDLFALVKMPGNEKVRLNLEIKTNPEKPGETEAPEAFARKLIKAVREAGLASRVTIQSFDWRSLAVVHKDAAEIGTAFLTSPRTLGDGKAPSAWTAPHQIGELGSAPKMVKAAGGKLWSPNQGYVTAENLKEARDLGLSVIVWTVNEPQWIAKILDFGVDGIITDRPDLVRAEMKKRGL